MASARPRRSSTRSTTTPWPSSLTRWVTRRTPGRSPHAPRTGATWSTRRITSSGLATATAAGSTSTELKDPTGITGYSAGSRAGLEPGLPGRLPGGHGLAVPVVGAARRGRPGPGDRRPERRPAPARPVLLHGAELARGPGRPGGPPALGLLRRVLHRQPVHVGQRARSVDPVVLRLVRPALEDPEGGASRDGGLQPDARRGCRATTTPARCRPGTCWPRSACTTRPRAFRCGRCPARRSPRRCCALADGGLSSKPRARAGPGHTSMA